MAGTFVIDKIEIKKTLTAFGVSERSIESLLATLDKMHRHVNAVVFVKLLQNIGIKQTDISNILRRVGIDDVSISNVFEKVDEERIQEAFGRIVDMDVE